jgi:pseudaminic acid cytidylyltransferase
MTRRLAVVPARGGSKRIPNKNIRPFCDRPMIAYVLDAAGRSGLFDEIHVSTDSDEIRAAVQALGVPVPFLRPAELADDATPIMPVLRYVLDAYAQRGRAFDQVWCLMACAPLITPDDLREAATLFDGNGGVAPVLAVAEYPAPVEWAFTRDADGRLAPVQPGMFAASSQELGRKVYDAGAFAVFPAARVGAAEGAGSDAGFVGHVLPRARAVDIDDEADWRLAEALYRAAHPTA